LTLDHFSFDKRISLSTSKRVSLQMNENNDETKKDNLTEKNIEFTE
jgi:hypothetical protein